MTLHTDLRAEAKAWLADHPGVEQQPAHARLGPSGADRWMVCHGAPNAEDGLPNDSSEFAAEGTAAHEVSDLCLSLGFEPYEFVGQTYQIDGFTIDFDDDMADALQPGIDWTREQPGTFYGECKVDLSEWLGEGQFGTSDRFIVAPDMLTVADLKFGRGVPVSPVDNKQAMLYALGAWRRFASHITDPAFPVRIVIDQPRCTGGGGEWMTTLGRLLEFGEEARAAALLTLDPNAPRVASAKGCMWCRRRTAPGGCYAFDEHNLDLLGQKFEDLDDGPIELPRALTPERRSVVLLSAKMIEKWLADLHTECTRDAQHGHPTGLLKAVDGPVSRSKFKDKTAVHTILKPLIGEARFENRLIAPSRLKTFNLSPEDMEKLVELIEPGASSLILVPLEDARPAIEPMESKFDEVE